MPCAGASMAIFTGTRWVTLVKLPEALPAGISENCDTVDCPMFSTFPRITMPGKASTVICTGRPWPYGAEFRLLVVRCDPHVQMVEHGENRLARRNHVAGERPSFRDHAAERGNNDGVGELGLDNSKIGLRRGDLRGGHVALRFREPAGAFRVVVLLLRNDLALELLVDAVEIVHRLCKVYRCYFRATRQVAYRGLGPGELGPQINVVEPHQRVALLHRVALVRLERNDPVKKLGADGHAVRVDISVVRGHGQEVLHIPVPSSADKGKKQDAEGENNAFAPEHGYFVDGLVPVSAIRLLPERGFRHFRFCCVHGHMLRGIKVKFL